MNSRVLFVDDDQSVLNMLERNFSIDFETFTAASGPEALKIIEDSEPFAVTLVDMRMPEMEGIELIQKARDLAPDSSYIMLTGNQDLTTAIDAVNHGQVFRFLNKPCEIPEIRNALDAGATQYDLVVGQKELLNKTFMGAVGVLTDIIESVNDPLFDSNEIKSTALTLAARVGIEVNWAMPLAARLLVVATPLLADSQRTALVREPIATHKHDDVVKEMVNISGGLIRRIPRLEPVTEVLDAALTVDGSLRDCESDSASFATVLLISFYIELLRRNGVENSVIVKELRKRFSRMDAGLLSQLQRLLASHEVDDIGHDPHMLKLCPDQLREGMIVASDIMHGTDIVLATGGRRLTTAMIARLRQIANVQPIVVNVLIQCSEEADLVDAF